MTWDSSFIQTILIALTVGAASGTVGSFIILRRMALVGDALSHVALPGIALALAYGTDPFWGVLAFLVGAAVIMWALERNTALPSDAIVGLLFTASLAVGILTIPDHEIIESLFGAFPVFSLPVFILVVGAAVLASVLSFVFARQFLFDIVSRDLAVVAGIGSGYRLLSLTLFVLVIALGIKLVGTLLMGALTIIPAAIARNVSRSMRGYMLLSASLGGGIACVGVIIANSFALLPGPTIILTGITLFLVSLPFARA